MEFDWRGKRVTTKCAPGSLDGLATAAAVAVSDSNRELDRLEGVVADVIDAIPVAVDRIRGASPEDASGAVDAFQATTDAITRQLRDHFAAQRDVLGSFNIVFFGRTGAGKSTLLSAMGALDGERVSQGESDWTTAVEPIEWHGCKLYDTPGINGRGRTMSRCELEARARHAVQIADIVLLCFDTQSQQASEFQKVADWVRDFGKPVIAVLNERNARWGLADKVHQRSQRLSLSLSTRQHAAHIAEELEIIGLFDVPVVAINSNRALAGRAAEPYRGPNQVGIAALQQRYGREGLVENSNYAVLETLIASAVTSGGGQLRTAALQEGVRRHLTELSEALESLRTGSQEPLLALDRSIQGALDVLGYLDTDSHLRSLLWSRAIMGDALAIYEDARGEPYTSRRKGSYQRHARHLLRSHLNKERAASLARAERLIIDAFTERRDVSSADFESGVINRDAVNAAGERVSLSAGEFLQRELDAAIGEGLTDAQFLQENVRIKGNAGHGFGVGGDVLRGVGMIGNAVVACLVAGAALNSWNPVGWASLIAAGAISGLIGWFGRKAKKQAEKEKVRARAKALADARRAVNEYFDELEDRIDRSLLDEAWKAASPALLAMLVNGVSLRATQREIGLLMESATVEADRIPSPPSSAAVISDAVRAVVQQWSRELDESGRPDLTLATVLMRETWIDGQGAHPLQVVGADHAERQVLIDRAESDAADLSDALGRMWTARGSDAALRWLDTLEESAREEPALAPIFERANKALDMRPRIAIVGDYSAGKSSLIKRLLIEAGRTAPPELSVRADPSTERVSEYPLRKVVLVDTPGFQSGNAEHDRQAVEAVADAALVVFVLHNNLVIGDTTFIEKVMKGADGALGKRDRALFFINRADGIVGGDPADDPKGFLRARDRREDELERALLALGITIDEDRLVTIASDPFGLVGDAPDATADDYGAGRDWDGIGAVRAAFDSRESELVEWGRPVAAVDGAATRLLALQSSAADASNEIEAGIRYRASLLSAIQTAARDAETMEQSLVGQARRLVDQHAGRILQEALGATEDELPAVAKQLERWWEDPAFVDDVERFNRRTQRQVDDWYATHSSAIGREAMAAEFRAGSLHIDHSFSSAQLRKQANAARIAGQPMKLGAQAAKALGKRDAFYSLGKSFRVKFKPWGAVKGAQRMAKFGAVLAAVGVALDGAEWILDRKNDERREQARLAAADYVERSSAAAVNAILEGPDESGPVTYLRTFTTWFGQLDTDLMAQQESGEAASAALSRRIGVIANLLDGAKDVLNIEVEGEAHEAA